jgi:hypothetical protein
MGLGRIQAGYLAFASLRRSLIVTAVFFFTYRTNDLAVTCSSRPVQGCRYNNYVGLGGTDCCRLLRLISTTTAIFFDPRDVGIDVPAILSGRG